VLVLSRQVDETIMIGDDIEVTVVDIRGDKVRLGITAPKEIAVHRKEVYEAIKRENRAAAQVKPGTDGRPVTAWRYHWLWSCWSVGVRRVCQDRLVIDRGLTVVHVCGWCGSVGPLVVSRVRLSPRLAIEAVTAAQVAAANN